ncbi:MAG: hypothetical protein R3B70_45065 [Polyangiaceae bacterium]
MKHSIAELIDIVYSYFPRGLRGDEPHYRQTPEYLRRMEARIPASTRFGDWCAMLARLRARFPQGLREIGVQNGSPFLASPGAATLDQCFTGALWLPPRDSRESHHELELLVSFVVPYFVIYSSCVVPLARSFGSRDAEPRISFDLTPDEVPFVGAITEEIVGWVKSSFFKPRKFQDETDLRAQLRPGSSRSTRRLPPAPRA